MADDRTEIDAVRRDLFVWGDWQRDPRVCCLAGFIYGNLELDEPPLPILAIQVEQLAALLGRKAKM